MTPLSKLKSLEVLHLRENEITTLTGLDDLTELREVNLRMNLIQDLNEFDHMANATKIYRFTKKCPLFSFLAAELAKGAF